MAPRPRCRNQICGQPLMPSEILQGLCYHCRDDDSQQLIAVQADRLIDQIKANSGAVDDARSIVVRIAGDEPAIPCPQCEELRKLLADVFFTDAQPNDEYYLELKQRWEALK